MSKRNLIAFSGTHGTGKSFRAYNFAIDLKLMGYNVVVLDELARECPLKINKEAGILTQYWILASQMKKEIKLMDRYDYIISDRSVFDTIAYAVTLGLIDFSNDSLISNYVRDNYFKIFVLDPDAFDYQVDDGVRDMDVGFRYTVHTNLLKIYDQYGIDYYLARDNESLDNKLHELFK